MDKIYLYSNLVAKCSRDLHRAPKTAISVGYNTGRVLIAYYVHMDLTKIFQHVPYS